MKTQRNMTMMELIDWVRMRNKEYASRPSAPEIDLPIVKKLREEQKRKRKL